MYKQAPRSRSLRLALEQDRMTILRRIFGLILIAAPYLALLWALELRFNPQFAEVLLGTCICFGLSIGLGIYLLTE